jgi:hypothetical protein
MSLTKLSLPGILKLFPARKSLVSDIPARDSKSDNLFYSVNERFHSDTMNCTIKDFL